ncbi:hypothetical protein HMPREF1980_00251 [Actinomyces sp. oral taxon 172 str. F0311]|nr:hypothetical protein HMPREF1980_00251 [Actinomyces sp. oral taxon 172 str. F0311]
MSARSLARLISHAALASLSPRAPTNFACNSPATISNFEFAALELQRFEVLLNFQPIELHAKLVWSGPVLRRGNSTSEFLQPAR